MNLPELQQKTFLLLLLLVTLAFGWILLPFYGAIFWGATLALLFHPLHRRLLALWGPRPNQAALATTLTCLVLVIIPIGLLSGALIEEGAALYKKLQSGEPDFGRYFQQGLNALPGWLWRMLGYFDLTDASAIQQKLSSWAGQGSQFLATQALNLGQNTFQFFVSFFVMLYLLFFLLRDGVLLAEKIKRAIPLGSEQKRYLLDKFTTVVRATVKGNLIVAIVQGALGGLAFWCLDIHGALLWSVAMAFLSLLPAVGAALIWGPVAIYFLLTGATWQGLGLMVFGILVIGLVDNLLRPILVGKDTRMPDYIVLISTLGGMAIFGLNGFVIGPAIAALFIATWDLFTQARIVTEQP
ncbi:AI-2E family transporter [Chitiniphilus eburneus]|uniref:AI-2E family transporter n=1 Tax=Chitiniphilus eburneus TaxID=2571148 RepID=A0A4U0Q079_9NEIS|nr:AI-2E family transporter [Chitiniphilus eburneus]TJZ74295.1 AI-2E family transporter [Chitiniphilus eburneus]